MAKQVSVSPTPMKVKKFTFLLTIDDDFRQLNSCNKIATRLTPEDVVNVKLPHSLASVEVCLRDEKYLYFRILVAMHMCPYFKVSVVNTKKENLSMYERHWLTNGEGWITTDGLISIQFLSHKENGFLTQHQLTFMFEVDCIVKSNDNQVESSAGVPLQDRPNHLRSAFRQLFDSRQFSDVTLNGGDSTVKAHKVVLIARSPVFAAMFQHDMQEQKLKSITITDIVPEVLNEMLRYMYTDNIPNLDAMAEQLLEAADKYEILNLKLECEESLLANISIENAAFTLMLADRFNAEHLKAKTLDYITANCRDVMETENWKEMVKTGSNVHLVAAAFRALALKFNV